MARKLDPPQPDDVDEETLDEIWDDAPQAGSGSPDASEKDWNEAEHPRDDAGRFTDEGGIAESDGKPAGEGEATRKITKLSADMLKIIKSKTGRDLSGEALADLAGAQPGTEVTITLSDGLEVRDDGGVQVEVTHKDYKAVRVIFSDYIRNEDFSLSPGVAKGSGIGTKVFNDQVQAAAALGYNHLSAHCAGSAKTNAVLPEQHQLNGYYTWARLGYDVKLSDIPNIKRIKIPPEFSSAERVSDLMKTPEGRAFWKSNGDWFGGKFDLADGSISRRVLDEYVKERASRKSARSGRMGRRHAGRDMGPDGRGVKYREDQARDEAGRFADEGGGQGGKPVTRTAAFRKWFGRSKVVDEHGNPRVVYHGTKSEFTEFNVSAGRYMLDRMVGPHFTQDPKTADVFTTDAYSQGNTGSVKPVYLSIQKPKVIDQSGPDDAKPSPDYIKTDQQAIAEDIINETMPRDRERFAKWYAMSRARDVAEGRDIFDTLSRGESIPSGHANSHNIDSPWYRHLHPVAGYVANYDSGLRMLGESERAAVVAEYRERLMAKGYDGLSYINTSPTETASAADKLTWIVFKPTQIKSATVNSGEFSADDPDITKVYDPNQPRDEHGRWSGDGQSGISLATDTLDAPPKNEYAWSEVENRDSIVQVTLAADRAIQEAAARPSRLVELANDPVLHYDRLTGDPPTDVQLLEYSTAVQVIAERLPEKIRGLLQLTLEKHYKAAGVHFYPNTRVLTEKAEDESGRKFRGTVGGFFDWRDGSLHLDGPLPGGIGMNANAVEIIDLYAHEISHVLDSTYGAALNGLYSDEPKEPSASEFGNIGFSSTPEWKHAYDNEIDLVDSPLSMYATTSRAEGFAEFGRLVLTNKEEAKKFPNCWKFWVSEGLAED